MAPQKRFQLLEINIIAAQDLEPVSRKMKTYVTAWVHPNRKLTSRIDSDGHNNPTWNDKFVFRVEEEFLQLDTAAVMLEIHSRSWFKDTLVGTVRVLVGNLFPPHTRPQPNQRNLHLGMRFVALQVRRQSGRPQGILNIGVSLLDGSMRSMPLYNTIAASAVGYHDLMGEDRQNQHENNNKTITQPILRRSISERSGMKFDNMSMTGSSMVGVPNRKFDNMSMTGSSMIGVPHRKYDMSMAGSSMVGVPKFDMSTTGSSMVGVPHRKYDMSMAGSSMVGVPKFDMSTTGSSMVGVPHRKYDMSIAGSSMVGVPQRKVPVKANSMVGGSEFGETIKINGVKGKASSVINGAELRNPNMKEKRFFVKKNTASEVNGSEVGGKPTKSALGLPPRSSVSGAGRYMFAPPPKPYSTWSDSEVGPSPSEVAAGMMERKYPLDDAWSSVLDGWSLDESVEGLRSKLERWRTELPPLYDRGGSSSFKSSTTQQTQTQKQTADINAGLFTCFGNFAGYECQCVCGKPRHRKRSLHSPSVSGSSKGGSTFL